MSVEWRRAGRTMGAAFGIGTALFILSLITQPFYLHLLPPAPYASAILKVTAGIVVFCALIVTWLVTTHRLRQQLEQLRVETRGVVEFVSLDPVWLPVGRVDGGAIRPGLVFAGPDGVRLTGLDRTEIVLDAPWSEVADIIQNHAPQPIVEIVLHQRGAVTHWWFETRPFLMVRGNEHRPGWLAFRTARDLIDKLDALRATALARTP